MNAIRIIGVVILCVIGLGSPAVHADSLCPDRASQAAAAAQLKDAEDLERAGKVREAYSAAAKANSECVPDYKRHEALLKRTAKAIGADEEKKGRFQEAFTWYERAQSPSDAGRMQRKLVEAKPDDINTVSRAIDYFVRQRDEAQEKALRSHALSNVEKALAEEEKQFATFTRDSRRELALARDWSYYAKAGGDRVRSRAAKRGDTLAAENGRNFLNLALAYYDTAGQPESAQRVREKARTLAKEFESKGDGVIAAEYYTIAGDRTKASSLLKQTEARDQRAEESRKKTFKKGQDDLEKALGF